MTRSGRLMVLGFALVGVAVGRPQAAPGAEYSLLATPETVACGYYSGLAKPVLTVHSGNTVRMQTLSTCGSPEQMQSRDDAYMLVSVAVDVDITQLVDGNVGVHAICPKKIFTAP